MRRIAPLGFMIAFCLLGMACSSTRQAANFNGLTTPGGKPLAHLYTSNMGLHLFGKTPLIGDATLTRTVADFTAVAKMKRAGKVRIVQSSIRSWWFVYPPFSFVLTPVTSNVAGDVLE